MAVAEVHPSAEELTAFTLGTLDDETQAFIEDHVATCASCQERAATAPGDSFVELVRSVHARPAALAATVTDAPQAHTPTPRLWEAVAVAPSPAVPADSEPADDLNAIPPELARHERYRVVRLLGQGGMGSVYEAEQIAMQRRVALKVIRRADTASPAALERFRREVRAAARLSHPNIVTAYDAETAGELHFLVMEYAEGISLTWLVKERGPLPLNEPCAYIQQAALGLQHAHERGLVHRDIKPDNLIRCSDGTVKILDFGLAALTAEGGGGLTEANVVMGTPDYMAPEQAENSHGTDIRADLYSLGCTLYFLLTSKPPYPAPTPLLKVLAHRDRPVPSLRRARPDVPPELAAVVERLLAKKPADRYQTPHEVAAALQPFTRSAARPRRKRGSLLVAAAVAALFAVIVLAGAAVYRIATDKGELVIETDNDDVEVVVSKGGQVVKIIDAKSGKNVTLNSGDYELALKEGQEGLKLSPEKMTLKRGETVLATITRRGKPAPPEGMVAWWRAEKNAKDSVGSNHGTLKGGVKFAPGVAGQAFDFNGIDGRIDLGNAPSLHLSSRDFSISAWVNFRSLKRPNGGPLPGDMLIVGKMTGVEDGWGLLKQDDNHFWFGFGGGDHNGFGLNFPTMIRSTTEAKPEVWYNVVVVKTAARFSLYVNGIEEASKPLPAFKDTNTADLLIGAPPAAGYINWMNGLIDEVAVYSRALSPAEVKAQWSALAPAIRPVAEKVGEIRRFEGLTKGAWGVAFSPDGRYALSGGGDGTCVLWEAATGREVRRFSGHDKAVEDIAFSPDGRQALTASQDQTARLWDVQTGKEIRVLKGHTDSVYRVAFSPNGRRALSSSVDGTMRLWDLESGNELRRFPMGAVGVAFSPDGRRALSGGLYEPLVRLWDVETGAGVRNLSGHKGRMVTDVVFLRLDDLYRPLLRAWVARAGVPASDVDDLAQDVLSVVVRRIAGFEWRGQGAFRAWLRTILANEVRDYFRDLKYRPIATGDSGFQGRLDELESPDSALSRLWDREHDKHVIASLMQRVQGDFSPVTWQAFRRHVQEGEPAGQVAEALGLSLNSVLLAKSRVLKRLREEAAGLVE